MTFISAVGRALLKETLTEERKSHAWGRVAASIHGLGVRSSTVPLPRLKLPWSLPLPSFGVRFGLIGLALVVVGVLALTLWPKPTPITPAAMATRMVQTFASMNGYHRLTLQDRGAQGRVTVEEWARRPDHYRRIERTDNARILMDEVIVGYLNDTYYPVRNLVVRQRTLSVDLQKLEQLMPWEAMCMMGILQDPKARVARESSFKGDDCWVVEGPSSSMWIRKKDYLVMKSEARGPAGKTVTGMETLSFEALDEVPDRVFAVDWPAGAQRLYGLVPISSNTGLPQPPPFEGILRQLELAAKGDGAPVLIPRYLPPGFQCLQLISTINHRHQFTFFNPNSGGTLTIVERYGAWEKTENPDGEGNIAIGSLEGNLARFDQPFQFFQLEVERDGIPVLITATQVGSEELVKVAEKMQVLETKAQPGTAPSARHESALPSGSQQHSRSPVSAPLKWDNHTESFSVRPVRQGLGERSLNSAAEILKARLETAGAKSADYQVSAGESVRFTVAGLPHELIEPLVTPVGRFSIKSLPPQYRPQAERDAFGREMTVCTDAEGRQVPWATSLAGAKPVITNKDLAEVTPEDSPDLKQWVLEGRLNASGTERFEQFTARNVARHVPIQVDGQVITCPAIRAAISGGRFPIVAGFDEPTARSLAAILSHKPLPCSFAIVPDELRHSHPAAVSSHAKERSNSSPPNYRDETVISAQCQSTIKQLITGCLLYAREHGGKLPPASTWCDSVLPYTKNPYLFHCPGKTLSSGGYAFNEAMSGKKYSDYILPNDVVVLFETDKPGKNLRGGPALLPGAGVHKDGINVAYADGHVKWLNVERAKREDWKGVRS